VKVRRAHITARSVVARHGSRGDDGGSDGILPERSATPGNRGCIQGGRAMPRLGSDAGVGFRRGAPVGGLGLGGGGVSRSVRRDAAMGKGAALAAIWWRRRTGGSATGQDRAGARPATITRCLRARGDPRGAEEGVWRITASHCDHPRSPGHGLRYVRMSGFVAALSIGRLFLSPTLIPEAMQRVSLSYPVSAIAACSTLRFLRKLRAKPLDK